MPPIDQEYLFENMRQRRMLSLISRGQFFGNPVKGGIRRNSPSQSEPVLTEAQLLSYIMDNFPPDLIIDPEVGIQDASGNNVTITVNGAPTVNATGGLNDRGYIAFDGTDDAIIADRVDIGTYVLVFQHNNASQMIHNVPTSNTGTGDTPKSFKQGVVQSGSPARYTFYPDSGGTIRPITVEFGAGTAWRCMVTRGEGYAYNNGQSCFRIRGTAVADTTVTKMMYGCWGRGDGANLSLFTAYNLGLNMIWSTPLTDDQLHILQAYLELRYNSFGKVTYQYKNQPLEQYESNPNFDGNVNSLDPFTQSYPARVFENNGEWEAIYKQYTKDFGGSSSSDGLTWDDEPVVLAALGSGMESAGVNVPCLVLDNGVYKMLYSGRNDSGEYEVGYATNSTGTLLSGWVRGGSNPVITLETINTPLGTSYTQIFPGEIIKVNGTWHVYVVCSAGSGNSEPGDLILLTGADLESLGSPQLLLTFRDTFLKPAETGYANNVDDTGMMYEHEWFEPGGIVKVGNKYHWLIAIGRRELLTTNNSKFIVAAVSDDLVNWKVVGATNINQTHVNPTEAWEDSATYWPFILKEQDGEYLTPKVIDDQWYVYYAGFSSTQQSGQSGLAFAPKKILTHLSEILS